MRERAHTHTSPSLSHTDIISRACSQGHGDLNYLPPHLHPPLCCPLPSCAPLLWPSNAAFEGIGGRGRGNGHVPLAVTSRRGVHCDAAMHQRRRPLSSSSSLPPPPLARLRDLGPCADAYATTGEDGSFGARGRDILIGFGPRDPRISFFFFLFRSLRQIRPG